MDARAEPFHLADATDPFRRALVISVIGHGVFLLFLIAKSIVFPTAPPVALNLLPAVRVDVVDLPDILKKDLNTVDLSLPPSAKPTLEEAPAETVKEEKGPGLTYDPAEEKKRKKIVEKLRADLKRRAAVEKLRGATVRGNLVSKGNALQGAQLDAYHAYYSLLNDSIRRRWSITPWLKDRNLRAVAIVRIGKRGELLALELTERSGFAEFDREVVRSIQNAAPFPPPEEGFADDVARVGVGFKFPE